MSATLAMIDNDERVRRKHRKDAYHLAAGRNRLPSDPNEMEYDYTFIYLTQAAAVVPRSRNLKQQQHPQFLSPSLRAIKINLIKELAKSSGDVTTPEFQRLVELLERMYNDTNNNINKETSVSLDGMWLTLSKPIYTGCVGRNKDGLFLYELGRMSFGMFRPHKLICSIQGTFNPVHSLPLKEKRHLENVPSALKDLVQRDTSVVRTYK
jgi:hypothetical protein